MTIKIHPTAIVQTNNIGEDSVVWQYSVVMAGASIGKNCNISCHCFVENDVLIGNNVTLKSGVYVWDGLVIEDNVFVGPHVTFTNDLRPRSKRRPEIFEKTILKKGASIGGGAVLVPGITIGEYSLIGAGSVVTKDVQNNTLWYGNPAQFRGYVCNCGASLKQSLSCPECSARYQLIQNSLKLLS